jgi:hypothetical protein
LLARRRLGGCKKGGEEGGTLRHRVDYDVLIGGVGAVAYGAEAVEGGDAEGGGEVAVGAAAGRGFAEREPEIAGNGFGAGVKGGALFAFERWAIEAAEDFEFRTAMNGLEGVEAFFEGAHIAVAPGAEIERSLGAVGDDVRAGAAGDDVRVDGDAAAEIVPLFEARDLCGEFVHRIEAFFGCEAGVRGATVDDELGFAHALAGSFQQAARTKRRFEYEDRVASLRFLFNQFMRRFAADLFVGGPEKHQSLLHRRLQFTNGFEGEERLDDSGFHVESAWAVGFAGDDAKGHFGERASRIDGVVVAKHEELRFDTALRGFPADAEMIASVLLAYDLRDGAMPQPLFRQQFAAPVRRLFFQAGRFKQRQFAQGLHHLRQPFPQVRKEGKWGHRTGMVARLEGANDAGGARSGLWRAK